MPSTSEIYSSVLQAAPRDRLREHSSERTREDLVYVFKKAFNGLQPYDWQLDVRCVYYYSESILASIDTTFTPGNH